MHFWCLSNHLQLPWDLWKGVTVHDQTCPCAHWFRWGPFWAPVVHCNLINNKNLTVIKFKPCTVNILGQLSSGFHGDKIVWTLLRLIAMSIV
jgi:hypothetical protein